MPQRVIEIDPASLVIEVGATVQLTAIPANGVRWESGNEAVATVTSLGLVTGVGVGTTTIRVRRGSRDATVDLQVVAATPETEPPVNQPPVVSLTVSSVTDTTADVVLSTLGTEDPDDSLVSYTIDWDDGQSETEATAPFDELTHRYTVAGTYTPTLTVTSSDGRTASGSVSVNVAEAPADTISPTAVLNVVSADKYTDPVVLSTAGTTDTNGAIEFYGINYGDNQSEEANTPPPATLEHTYAAPGTYNVTLTVVDDEGQSGEVTIPVTVVDVLDPPPPTPPDATLTYVSGGSLAVNYIFSTTGTSTGLDEYSMNWGDGTVDEASGDVPPTFVHQYEVAGEYVAELTVTDNGVSSTAARDVRITEPIPPPQPPNAFLVYQSGGVEDQPFTVSTVGTSTGLDGYEIDWDDDTIDTDDGDVPAALSHIYTTPGSYTITLQVVNEDGIGQATLVATITVAPVANQGPLVNLALVSGGFVNQPITVSTSGTQDPDGTIAFGAIEWGDGQITPFSGTPNTTYPHTYTTTGTKSIRITATDDDGAFAEKTIMVSIAAQPSPGDDAHSHFEYFSSLPECVNAWSLRSQAAIDSLVPTGTSRFFRYLFGTGQAHPYAPLSPIRDACKLAKPPRNTFTDYPEIASYGDSGDESVPGNQTLRFPVVLSSGTLVLTYDYCWGSEVQANRGTVETFKTSFLWSGDAPGIFKSAAVLKDALTDNVTDPPLQADEATKYFIELVLNGLPAPAGWQTLGSGSSVVVSTGQGALPPRRFVPKENVWTRYAVEIKMDQPGANFTEWSTTYLSGVPLTGTWDMVSMWAWDENRDAQRILYRVPFPPIGTFYTQFRIAWNTSSHNLQSGTGLTGPIVVDLRNVILLHNYTVVEGSNFFNRPRP